MKKTTFKINNNYMPRMRTIAQAYKGVYNASVKKNGRYQRNTHCKYWQQTTNKSRLAS